MVFFIEFMRISFELSVEFLSVFLLYAIYLAFADVN